MNIETMLQTMLLRLDLPLDLWQRLTELPFWPAALRPVKVRTNKKG